MAKRREKSEIDQDQLCTVIFERERIEAEGGLLCPI